MDFRRFQTDAEAFRDAITIPVGGGSRLLREVAADFQETDFRALDRAFLALAAGRKPEPYSRFWLERTKGASKDSDLAIMLLWLLAFSRRALEVQVGAGDQNQADELRKAAKEIVRLNPWLGSLVDVQTTSIVNKRTEARADILTTDGEGSHGGRPDLVILNEVTHLGDGRGKEFAETLLDNASKMPHGVVVVATNAGHTGTWQEKWKNSAKESDRWYYSTYDEPAPWLDPEEIAEAKRRNSTNRFLRLWKGQWVGSTSSALSKNEVDRAIILDGPASGPEKGWAYGVGVDLGITRDFSAAVLVGKHVGHVDTITQPLPPMTTLQKALIEMGHIEAPRRKTETIVHPGTNEIRACRVAVWKPEGERVELSSVQSTIESWHRVFHVSAVLCDFWQAAMLAELLVKARVPADTVNMTGNVLVEMGQATIDAFRERLIRLYPDDGLIDDLRTLKAIEKGYGTKLECPRTKEGGHGDRGTALQLALLAAKRLRLVDRGIEGRRLVLSAPGIE